MLLVIMGRINNHSCSWPKRSVHTADTNSTILTDEIIFSHLQASGKRLRPKKNASNQPANIGYRALQRGHQYYIEGYIPGKHVMFCLKDEIVWIKA